MSDANSNPPTNQPANQPATPTTAIARLDPVTALFALGSKVRWPIVNMLADGRIMSIGEVAAALGRDIDGVGRQLKVLAASGVVNGGAGKDRRQTVYYIPAERRPSPGVLDYGFCVLHLDRD